MEIVDIKDWGLGLSEHVLIAGPCSAESPQQIESIAKGLRGSNIEIFRAGVWKPRTRPGSFEGVGSEALGWLDKAREILNVPVTVEVANTAHVEAALKAGVDVLWIGARTTVNPFSVQEICDALKGTDIPVMVKNPINPDLQLWLGAIERLNKVGINKIAGIHRGFSDPYEKRYRNKPEWSMPIHLKRMLPGISVICDPSHIAGTREIIASVSQRAINFGLDGLMIETHHDPDNAWSDAKQQVTPDTLKIIYENLNFRETLDKHPEAISELDEFRQKIDLVDTQIIELLSDRFQMIKQIGEYKREHNLAVYQPNRWHDVMESRINSGVKKNMTEKFMKSFLFAVHEESVKMQEAQLKEKV
ncbi:bifunctional 3-deoxy-7-phosphoheptulonate synthase/chorismate mutase type II [Roseivirga sp. E12]|uniref:bifunctional 3-deoxy-7-phosphoheptulonate synthase/chorismate mutase type II n=1 Tax=Roseivirga sp. E12 TaxID=2819237 RepID=UPI001ABC23F1|nr:bifunctional 3-deoxy-7-phosphoheptulonate synthase/chorismate mutase type II [Roseivirga sp. E12]MBO3700049.1 bifunctional 3-deoxy-7-phosphoheptulonate synthase/chorismate mutase type II [Roseivirga sp. E12]